MPVLQFITQALLGELIVVIAGVFFAYIIKKQYDNWRYGRYSVRILQDGEEKVNRAISPRKAEEILNEPADLAVFLKGVASPYGWINCDLISEGQTIGLLIIDREKREFLINLDNNPKKETGASTKIADREPHTASETAATPSTLSQELTVINFTHPLTELQRSQIEQLTGQTIKAVHPVPTQLDNSQPFPPQVAALLAAVPLTAAEWQTAPLLINPPAYAPAAATLLAQLHGRTGYFPSLVRLRPVANAMPVQYEVAEIVNLQTTRDQARAQR